MSPVIEVKNLIYKQYSIGQRETGYLVLSEILGNIAKKLISAKIPFHNNKSFWALKNVSFKVEQGEILGMIGANGAGKTTLLKILSRITPPTKGEIRLRGRMASLLEVGTGFHPELTGRENIFLNGAILGMTRQEIKSKLEEIVEFSGVSKFIDTPIKHYSSGMQVRLAFSVAAHLDFDILLVDEVLAVGDAEFQRKSLGKMQDVSSQGRTVIFVSHNLLSVEKLCKKTILIEKGRIKMIGGTKTVIEEYLNAKLTGKSEIIFSGRKKLPGNNVVRLLKSSTKNISNKLKSDFELSEDIMIEMVIKVLDSKKKFTPCFNIINSAGEFIFMTSDQTSDFSGDRAHKKGGYKKKCLIPGDLLAPGTYLVSVAAITMSPKTIHFFEHDIISFTVYEKITTSEKTSRGNFAGEIPGFIRPLLKWESKYLG